MVNNEPFQHKANYYKTLMFLCIDARYANIRKANKSSNVGVVLKCLQARIDLEPVININRSRAIFWGNAVLINRIFPKWCELVGI